MKSIKDTKVDYYDPDKVLNRNLFAAKRAHLGRQTDSDEAVRLGLWIRLWNIFEPFDASWVRD